MTWNNIIEGEVGKKNNIGFVYRITELDTGMFYIGLTRFWYDKKLKPLKGKVNQRHFKTETKWREYNSSNKELQEKIKNNPTNYEKIIVKCCKTITEMKALEAYLQLEEYLFGNWKLLYNQMINLRLRIRK